MCITSNSREETALRAVAALLSSARLLMGMAMAVNDRKDPKSRGVIPGGFWSGPTLEELAETQNVRPVERLEQVLGGWPKEELQDGFEEELARWRSDAPHPVV
jgi:hypothetical protein